MRPQKDANRQNEAAGSELDDDDVHTELGENEYKVDRILHERETPNGLEYLIKWQGYEEVESTWQTVEDITAGAEDILMRWKDDKKRVAQGFADPFNIGDWQKRNFAFLNPGIAIPVTEPKKEELRKSGARASQKKVRSKLFVSSSEDSAGSNDDSAGSNDDSATQNQGRSKQNSQGTASSNESKKDNVLPTNDSDNTALNRTMPEALVPVPSEDLFSMPRQDGAVKNNSLTAKKRKESPTELAKIPLKRTKSLSIATKDIGNKVLRRKSATSKTPTSIAVSPSITERTEEPHGPKIMNQIETARLIFGINDEDMLAQRKSTMTETSQIYAPSHIQSIIKKNQDGRAPDPKNLIIQDPSQLVRRPLNSNGNTPKGPATPTGSTESQGEGSSVHGTQKPLMQSKGDSESPRAQSIPLLCNYFAHDRICPEGAIQCRFLHETQPDLPFADITLHIQARQSKNIPDQWPKFQDPVIVCGHECRREGTCFRGYACLFAHWIPLKGQWHYNDHKVQKKNKTCLYWAEGRCNKPAEDCSFAHEMLGEIATPATTATRNMTCPFWWESMSSSGPPCRRSSDCKFNHAIRPMIASKPNEKAGPRPMNPDVLRAATYDFVNKKLKVPLQIDVPQPSLSSDSSNTPQEPTEPKILTIPIQQLSSNTPAVTSGNISDLTDRVMNSNLDRISGFSVTINIGFMQLPAQFVGLNDEICTSLQNCFGLLESSVQPRVSPWEDVKSFTWPLYCNKIANGKLLTPGFEREMAELADHLAHEGSALVMQAKDAVIVVFPSRGDLEKSGLPPTSTFAYEIRTASDFLTDDHWVEPLNDEGDWSLWFKDIFGIDIEDLFQWPTKPNMIKKDIFLLLDDCQEAEVEALSRCLRWQGIQVYSNESPGAWSEFKTRNEGVIIFDERFIKYRDIPNLSHFLFCRYNFFELATNSQTQSLTLKRLLKTGHTIFLTDEVLIQEPNDVLEIVRHVKERNRGKPPGLETRRLFARPNVTDWLLKLAEEHIEDHKAGDVGRASLWDEINNLMPVDSPRETLEFTDRVLYEPYWRREHAEEFETDPNAATDSLLHAFDLTFCTHREYSRHWIVLCPNNKGANEKAEVWKETYCNMKFMTCVDFKEKIMARD